MKKIFLLTGATGHLGTELLKELLSRGALVRALVLPGERDWLLSQHPGQRDLEVVEGDLTDPASLEDFLARGEGETLSLIHCAALVSILSRPDPRLMAVNAEGVRSLFQLALDRKVERVVYVNSVHSLPEKPAPQVVGEIKDFSPDRVHGPYAKSKAEGARIALEFASRGLALSMVHPSGLIGPGDLQNRNHTMQTLRAMARGQFPVYVKGGYDFADTRDVAAGILACEEKGLAGENYILSGHYISLKELQQRLSALSGRKGPRLTLPSFLLKAVAALAEAFTPRVSKSVPMLTRYSVYTIHTNASFSRAKAKRAFGYEPRPLCETLAFLHETGEL